MERVVNLLRREQTKAKAIAEYHERQKSLFASGSAEWKSLDSIAQEYNGIATGIERAIKAIEEEVTQ